MMEEISSSEVSNQGFEPSALFKGGFTLKSVDLIQGGTLREVIGKLAIFLMCAHRVQEDEPIFSRAIVILPPVGASKVGESDIYEALVAGLEVLRGSSPDEEELAYIKRFFRVIHCATLEAPDLVEIVASETDGCLIAIADASKYHDISVSLPAPIGLSAVRSPEDQWVPHVAGLCERCVAAVRETGGYAFLHVDETPPQNPELQATLVAIEHCYTSIISDQGDPGEIVARRMPTWISWAVTGKKDDAVKEIQALDFTNEAARLHLVLQLTYRARRYDETLNLLEQLEPHLEGFEKHHIVQLAWIAYKCGDSSAAQKLLPQNPIGVNERTWLEEGLELATQFENDELITRYDAQLGQIFPNSERLRENRDRRLLFNCREISTHSGYVFTTSGFSDRHLEILEALTILSLRYEDLIERANKWETEWFELAVICCAMHAHTVGKYFDAIEVGRIITASTLYGRQATQIVLSSTRALMLKGGVSHEERDYYRLPLMAVVDFLAQSPHEADVRASFSRLLSVEACGDFGLPVIAVTMLELADVGISNALEPEEMHGDLDDANEKADEDITGAALMRCLAWIGEQGYGEFGVTVLPRELVGPHPDRVIRLVSRMMLHVGAVEGRDMDLKTMSQIVLVACAIRPYASTEHDEDLRLLRLLAGHYVHAGRLQHARDMAEQILAIGQDTEVRRRLAWLAYADVYQRCRNPMDALLGLACAFATDTSINKADLWQEVYVAIRVFRDLGMTELAKEFLPVLKQLIADLGYDPEMDSRIVATELGLRVVEISRLDCNGVSALIGDLMKACQRARDKSEVLPLVVMLGQVVRAAEERSLAVPIKAREILKDLLGRVGTHESEAVEFVSSLVPTKEQVVSMFNSLERAMFGTDVASDLAVVGIAARRLLSESGNTIDASQAKSLAVELLADQTMTLTDSSPKLTADWALQYALSLNHEGLDVVFMALNTVDELSVTLVSKGYAIDLEQPRHEKSFRLRMRAWLEKYPKAYGLIDSYDGNNEFFNTMEALDVRLPDSEGLLIVAEPLLQQLTANLVVVKPRDGGFEYFYGSRVAVGFVPALSWLSSTRGRARAGTGGYRAWIAANSGSEATGTLDIALARMSDTFQKFGFVVDTNRRLPSDVADSSLVVVTGHGGLAQEGRYLHSIRDEEDLIEPPSALAESLAGVELVILFVCSGGRIDKHPWGNRTVGLPRQLLNKGVRAVIASAWPLDVKVTYTWLEPFMNAWNAGATVLQATKKANEVVRTRLGDHPQYSLAMSVYGDLLLRK